MNVKFIKPKNRNVLIARIRLGDGEYFDKSTGISSKLEFEPGAQIFLGNNTESRDLNSKIESYTEYLKKEHERFGSDDTRMFREFLNINKIVIKKGDTTLRGLLESYRNLMEANSIITKEGTPLSEETVESRGAIINMILRAPQDVLNFDFKKYNYSSFNDASNKYHWEMFKTNIISGYRSLGYEDSSIRTIIGTLKTIVKYMLKMYGVEVGFMLEELVFKGSSRKEVKVLTKEQYDFIINNFETIRSDCKFHKSRVILDYWVVALVLCMRMGSMRKLTRDNLVYANDKMYIQYTPSKTINSSGLAVQAPVPGIVQKIFERNLDAIDRPLPPLADKFPASNYLKNIVKNYKPFQTRVIKTEYRNGQAKQTTVFAWTQVTMHMGRATGITEYLEKGMPEQVVKSISAHSVTSKAFGRYVNIRSETTAEYLNKIWE